MQKVRWGILGAAKIAIEKVIPAMQSGSYGEITAIASRDIEKARTAARCRLLSKMLWPTCSASKP